MSTRLAAALGAMAPLAAVLAGSALAHEGHDHGAAPPPVSKTIAPRGEALSETFELVAVPRDGTLTLFLDRFRTNEPVTGATIDVETPDGPKTATATPESGYALTAPWMSAPGRHEFVATVTAGGDVDVLTVAGQFVEARAAPHRRRNTPVLLEQFLRREALAQDGAAAEQLHGRRVFCP